MTSARQRTVAVVAFGHLAREPRVDRQLSALRGRYRLVALGLGPPRFDDVEFRLIQPGPKPLHRKVAGALQLLGGRYERYYWELTRVRSLAEALRGIQADVIVAHDIDTLPAVVRFANGARILYDAHDYAPRQFEDRLAFRLFFQRAWTYFCRTYIPQVGRMTTVCDSLADAYQRDTGVTPVVITNAPDYAELQPALRNGGERTIRLVHHGAAIRSRRLEHMIRVMDELDDPFELDLFLVPITPGYLEELTRMAARRPRVRVRPPVPMPELPAVLNRYDVGVFLLQPVNFNYRFALPNKLFEFVQARLAVAVSPSVEMARLVREQGCGVVADDFSPRAFAACLRGLDHAQINAFKRRAHEVARALSSERNRVRFQELVAELAGP